VPCCVVRQDSLDIEQFSYKVAVIICKCQGYKFRFCNDYDIEIVDVSNHYNEDDTNIIFAEGRYKVLEKLSVSDTSSLPVALI